MKNLLKNILMAAAIGFTVGVMIATVAPTLAGLAGIAVTNIGPMANPLWMGLFAGSWGALGAAVTPAYSFVLNGFKSTPAQTPSIAQEPSRQPDWPELDRNPQFLARLEQERQMQSLQQR